MAVKIRRTYKGAAIAAALDSSGVSSATQTAISLSTSPSSWPTGKFFVVVAPGTAQEEKMCVTLSGSTLTTVDPSNTSTSASANGRGADDTTARSIIAGGASVYPVFTSVDANEANELTSTYANQGGIVYQGASTFTQLGIGTAGHVLKVNSGVTAPEWGQVGSVGIADGAVTTSKIDDGDVTLAKLAAAVANALVPVGTITGYGGASAPTGWLLCDGASFSAVTYPNLNTVLGGTTLPNLVGRFPMGKTGSGTGSTLLGTGGSNTIGETNLPSHTHTVSGTTGGMSANATLSHSVTDPGHTHVQTTIFYDVDTPGETPRLVIDPFSAPNPTLTQSNTTGITIANHSVAHTHTFSGTTSGGSGSGTAYFQPFVAVNYIIKHD
jgi:microcystin-dependent protein